MALNVIKMNADKSKSLLDVAMEVRKEHETASEKAASDKEIRASDQPVTDETSNLPDSN